MALSIRSFPDDDPGSVPGDGSLGGTPRNRLFKR